MGTHQRDRELTCQNFIIGQTRAGLSTGIEVFLIYGMVRGHQGVMPARPAAFGLEGRVQPFRNLGRPFQRSRNRLAQDVLGNAFGQGIDRLYPHDVLTFLWPSHHVGMGHLQPAVIELRGTAHQSNFALRKSGIQIVLSPVEIDQGDLSGSIGTVNSVGNPAIADRRSMMPVDRKGEGRHTPRFEIGKRWAVAAVDDSSGQMPQQIDDLFTRQSFDMLANPRSNPFQGRDRRKNRKQYLWSGTRRHVGTFSCAVWLTSAMRRAISYGSHWTQSVVCRSGTMTDENRNTRIRRLIYRSRYTGTKETDLLLGKFADRHLEGLDDALLNEYEALIENSDPDLYMWISGRKPVPPAWDGEIMRRLQAFTFDD